MPTKPADAAAVQVVIRDDVLVLAAGCLLALGTVLLVVAWVPAVGAAAAIAGVASCLGAIWILARPVGVVIDRRAGIVTSKGLIDTRAARFLDITGVRLSPSHPPLGPPGFPMEIDRRFDVVLVQGGHTWAVVKRDLDEPTAYLEVERIRSILG